MIYKKIISLLSCICFCSTYLTPLGHAQVQNHQPLYSPDVTVENPAFEPIILSGIRVLPNDPFRLNFLVHTGNESDLTQNMQQETNRLIKYFLASLTIPEKDFWVNLSPNEKNRIIPPSLEQTDLGKNLLNQDFLLKHLSTALADPKTALGKAFWDRVYHKIYERYAMTDIPIDTFNKIWIVAGKAEIFEKDTTAVVLSNHLKVSMEQKHPDSIYTQIFKEILVPEIEKEVNRGIAFAPLRQIAQSLILAVWYKKKLKKSIETLKDSVGEQWKQQVGEIHELAAQI